MTLRLEPVAGPTDAPGDEPSTAAPRSTRRPWTTADARRLYGLDRWSAGYVDINEVGHAAVTPMGVGDPAVDLRDLVDDLEARGIGLPALVRFSDILRARTDTLLGAFERAMSRFGYTGRYRGVIPVKVNQQWHVTRAVVEHGRRRGLGLEVGSKPELYIAIGLATEPDDLIVCNGFKDRSYVELALATQKLGRHPLLVIDRVGRMEHIIDVARDVGVRPHLGVRVKLSTPGAGCWSDSSGDHSKFGLDMAELLEAVEALREAGLLDCLELLHFHVGSQIATLDAVKRAVREATRIFVELCRMGIDLKYIDCGGGLAVEYGGAVDSGGLTVDYTVDEYAAVIVEQIGSTCAEAGIDVPTVLSESGRALLAHHSLLLFDVLQVHRAEPDDAVAPPGPADLDLSHAAWALIERPIRQPAAALEQLGRIRAEALARFNACTIDLRARIRFEAIANTVARRLLPLAEGRRPEDVYYCNFSLFQSLPDYWAIDQLFPVMPIHRLDQQPTRRGVLADLSCDSHGTVRTFIGDGRSEHGLMLHEVDGRYVLGVFLVGAYQKSLSSLHNLFGATNAVHVALTADGYELHEVAEGETIDDVLEYVRFPRVEVLANLRAAADAAVEGGAIASDEAERLLTICTAGIDGYTYLTKGRT